MKSNPLIDFTELVSAVPGEGLQELARQIGRRKGLSPVWSGRGPDGGRDLIFTESLSGPLCKDKIKWLVSCKDRAKSGKSISEDDLPSPGIRDKLEQHKANGFLLITTTTTSTGTQALLDRLDKSNGGVIRTQVWDSSELTAILLEPSNQDLLRQFLPQSYQRVKGLTTLEGAILAFQDQLPNQVLEQVIRLVKPYSEIPLKGSLIWPYDSTSATKIDQIIKHVLIRPDLKTAVSVTEEIEYDAFVALITFLHKDYPKECYTYLSAIIHQHHEMDIRFNAVQFLFDNYDIPSDDFFQFATHIDPAELVELCGSEVIAFVEDELYTNTPSYDMYQLLDELSSATSIESISITSLEFDVTEKRVKFQGSMLVYADLYFEKEKMGTKMLPGFFSGFFDAFGIYLEQASVTEEYSEWQANQAVS